MPNRTQVENQEQHGESFISFSEPGEPEFLTRFAQKADGKVYDQFHLQDMNPEKWKYRNSTRDLMTEKATEAIQKLERQIND